MAALGQSQQAATVVYHGGRLLTAVDVVTVFWGSAWTQPPHAALIGRLNAFFDAMLTSALVDLLAEYSVSGRSIGPGRRTATVTVGNDEPGSGTGTVSDADIQTALRGWIAARTLPAPGSDTLHFVYLPPGVTSTLQGQQSCQVFCGYHSHAGGNLFYAVEPYADCPGCTFGSDIFDSLTVVSSHELCEAITDPAGDGWYDDSTGDEIGDLCVGHTGQVAGYTVQAEWSNTAKACVFAPATARG